jgi:hypothetical protein
MQKKKKEPQNIRILKWLQRGRRLTQAKAYELFECFRLSGRVRDLRKLWHDVKTNMVKTNTGKWVAEYSL